MTAPIANDEQELLRLIKRMFTAVDEGDGRTLDTYIDDDFLLTYAIAEQGKTGFMNKAQILALWGVKDPDADADPTLFTEERILISGDTTVFVGLVTDTFREQNIEQVVMTWVSDVWVKRNGNWRWLASHESFLKLGEA